MKVFIQALVEGFTSIGQGMADIFGGLGGGDRPKRPRQVLEQFRVDQQRRRQAIEDQLDEIGRHGHCGADGCGYQFALTTADVVWGWDRDEDGQLGPVLPMVKCGNPDCGAYNLIWPPLAGLHFDRDWLANKNAVVVCSDSFSQLRAQDKITDYRYAYGRVRS